MKNSSFLTIALCLNFNVYAQDLVGILGSSLSERVARSSDRAGAPEPSEEKLLRERILNLKTLDPSFLAGSRMQQETGNSFFSTIHQSVDLGLKPRKIFTNADIDSAYGLPGREKSLETSLLSHPLCLQSPSSLSAILGADYVPDTATQQRINNFVNLSNMQRSRALKEEVSGREKFTLVWASFFSCLGYAESLSDPDSSAEADSAYSDYLNSNAAIKSDFEQRGLARRSPGVHFGIDHPGEYYIRRRAIKNDPNLSESEKAIALQKLFEEYDKWGPNKWVVAGLFQFTPEVNGNVVPCVNQWNENVTDYRRAETSLIGLNKVELSRALVSPIQSFNAYCGVQKIVQGFNSQVNTVNLTGVHPENILDTRRIKLPQNRCVSLVMRGGQGRMYTHFGPLRNSTQKNLAMLFQCVERSIIEELKN